MRFEIVHDMIPTNGVLLHTALAGPEDGQVAILLHGFPEFWYGWRRQIPTLAEAGLRVVVPDQRGYNLSDKPRAVDAYNVDQLADDVLGLIEHFGEDKVYLAGHDWGAAVAWWVALKYPEHFRKLAILNVPHPAVMRRHLTSNPIQLLRSWYIFFFQIPWLPEWILSLNGHANSARMLKESGQEGSFSVEGLKAYQEAWGQPGAWRSMINWYRAIFRNATQALPSLRVQIPTLILWGKEDVALNFKMAEDSLKLCDEAELHTFEHATHWVQHDEADQVNRLLIDFFK